MYCLALSFLALAALAAGSGYVPGREYVYRYRAHVSAGFPDKKPQYSGLVFEAMLHVQPHEGDYGIFQFEDRKYKTFNGDTTKKEKQPYHYEDLPPSEKPDTEPFKVYFKDGQVTKFQIHNDEPLYSVNVKRALISLFHITFEPTDPSNISTRDNEVYKPDYGEHYYKVMEDGVLGHCETQYVIEHLPYHKHPENNIVLNITKTRNYHKCDSVPNHYYSTFYGEECGESELDHAHTLHGNAFIHYDIRGDRHHYVIEKVTAEGDLGFTPYPLEGQTAEIYVNRTLELVEVKDSVTNEYHVSDNLHTYTSLEHEFDHKPKFTDPIDLKKPHYLYDIYGKAVPLEQIRELFTKLIHVYDDETYHEAAATKERDYPAIFLELVKSVSTLGYDDIEELYKEYADFSKIEDTPEHRLTRNLFLDVLVSTGTNPALLFGKTLVKTGKVPEPIVLHFLHQVPYHIKEFTQTLLDEAYALCKDDYIVHRPHLYRACYLMVANVIHDRCVARYHPERVPRDEHDCPDDVPQTFFNEISRKYKESDDEYRKTAYITALGRLGVKDSLKYLRHYVEGDAHQSLFDRTNAIYALKTIAKRYPELVRELIIPLYYNSSENYEVRIAAFNMLMKTHPQLYDLETIARTLIDEKDDQVRSYVYSAFHDFDNSTYPCHVQLGHHVRYALSILKPYHCEFEKYDHTYSHQHYVSGFNEDYGYGGYTRLAYLASDTGYIPRSVYLEVDDFMGGKSYDSFAIGFRQHGLEKLTDKILGPDGPIHTKSLFDLFKKRTAREVNEADHIRQAVKEKLHLPTIDYEHIDVELFFNYMGNQYSFLYFNATTFESFFNDGHFEIPDLPSLFKHVPPYRYQKFTMPVDLVYLIPSESGLPVIMDFKAPSYLYHKNDKLSLEATPAFFEEDRPDHPPTDVHLNVEGHFVADKQFIGSVGVVQRFDHMTFGAGINKRCTLSLPINLDVSFNLKDHNLDVKWKPVVPHQIYHFEFEPYTYIDSYDDNLAVVDEADYHPVRRMGYRKQISKELELGPFGLKLHVDKDFDNEWNDYGSLFSFFVRQSYRDKYYYLITNPQLEPYKYDVTLDNTDGEHITEVDGKLHFSFQQHNVEPKPSFADGEFEELEHETTDNLLTTVLLGEIVAHGNKERKVQGEIIHSVHVYDKYHKLNIYYERTPFFHDESEHTQACISGYMRASKPDEHKIEKLETSELDVSIEAELKAHFGKDCHNDQKLNIHARHGRSEEALELDHHRDEHENHEHYNPYAHLYQQCMKERTENVLFPKACVEYMRQVFKIHKYTYDVKYEHLSPRFVNFTRKIDEFFRHDLYDHSDTHYEHGPEGEICMEANFSAIYPVADVRVRTPERESHYTHVHVPHFEALSILPMYEDVVIKQSFDHIQCKVIVDLVETFDHYSYHLPATDCYRLVSKDCSPSQSFIILGKKVDHPKHKEAVKIVFGKHIVEMTPHTGESGIDIVVDGKKVPVSETEHYYHYEKGHTEHLFDIGLKHAIHYTLHSEQYGLVVEYDGTQISVELSPYYRGKLCGLCGNYNGQQYDGYVDENGCHIHDDEVYANRFSIPSDTCHAPQIESHDCHGEDHGCTDLKTDIVQLNTGKVPQTCFSTEPIPHCRTGCESKSHFTRTISYHCLPAKDDSTKHLLAESEHRVLHEVRRKSKDHEGEVEIQEGCHHA